MPQKSALFNGWCNYFKILPHCSVDFTLWQKSDEFKDFLRPLNTRSKGFLSSKAEIRVRTAMQWLMFFSERKFVWQKAKKRGFWFKVNFITLTLSAAQCHSDTYIVEHMLQPFLRWLQRSAGVINYVWKAECQDNGNIHFHITLNKFVHYLKIRKKWNELQFTHGYRSPGEDPNSTDVHSVVNEKAIIGYMVKYITKSDSEKKTTSLNSALAFITDPIEREIAYMGICAAGVPFAKRRVSCKMWGCNYTLSRINITLSEKNEYYYQAKQHFKDNTCTMMKDDRIIRIYKNDFSSGVEYYPLIQNALSAAKEMFNTNDDGITKYTVE